MIISKTPMRISFIGGGSDLPSFYNDESGLIVAGALDKHVYVSVLEKFDDDVRLSYSEIENVQNVANLRHDIARETLDLAKKELAGVDEEDEEYKDAYSIINLLQENLSMWTPDADL